MVTFVLGLLLIGLVCELVLEIRSLKKLLKIQAVGFNNMQEVKDFLLSRDYSEGYIKCRNLDQLLERVKDIKSWDEIKIDNEDIRRRLDEHQKYYEDRKECTIGNNSVKTNKINGGI